MASPTILIVDDNPALRDMFREVFSLRGFEAVVASDADSARRLNETGAFDAVLVDLELPGITGIELCRSLRTHSPGNKPGVWVMTGMDDPTIERTAAEAGAVEVCRKPFSVFQVCERIRLALELGTLPCPPGSKQSLPSAA